EAGEIESIGAAVGVPPATHAARLARLAQQHDLVTVLPRLAAALRRHDELQFSGDSLPLLADLHRDGDVHSGSADGRGRIGGWNEVRTLRDALDPEPRERWRRRAI